MARCTLDLSDPKFRIMGDASDADLQSGLVELQTKLARDHKLSNFFRQPMSRFPEFQSKIWKWDFAPSGDKSRTRKGWRLLAYVADPMGPEPILARAFICYDKDQDPKGESAKFVAEVLKEFLSQTIRIEATPERFRRQSIKDGLVSLCYECHDTIFSANDDEAELAESAHECPE